MKKLTAVIFTCVLLTPLAIPQDKTYHDDSFARMNYVSGDTYVQRAQDLGMEAGTVNLPVIAGDRLGTNEGRLEIHLGHQNFLRLDRQTQVDVVQLPAREADTVKLNLIQGEVYLRVSYLAGDQEIGIHTVDASFYVIEPGLFRLRTGEDQETELRVIEGSMEAAGEASSEVVNALERLVASQGGFVFGPARLTARYDDSFSDWNSSRDVLLTPAVEESYLPEELSAYEAELAENGHWVHERAYGYVWVPHVYHSTWRPYYHGRWLWYPHCGYTWVSFDPWGWCVSHYGRWQWRFGLGWYWIPRLGWGPGWVHWCHTSYHYGWLPLSYHGYPGVIYNNRYYGDRYYTNYLLGSRSLTMVHKRQLQNPNISRVALSGSQLRGAGRVRLSTRQPAVSPAVGTSRVGGAARIAPKSTIKGFSRSSARAPAGTVSRQGTIRSNPSTRSRSAPGVSRSSQRSTVRSFPSRSSQSSIRSRTSQSSIRSRTSRTSSVTRAAPRSRSATSSRATSRSQTIREMPRRSTPRTPTVSRTPSRSSSRSTAGRSSVSTRTSRSFPSRSSQSSIRSRTSQSSIRSRTSRTSSVTRAAPRSRSATSSRATSRSQTIRSTSRRSTPRTPTVSRAPSRSSSRSTVGRSSVSTRTSRSSSGIRSSVSSRSRSAPSVSRSSRSTPSRSASVSRSAGRSSRSAGRSTASRSSSSRSSGSRVRKK